MSNELFAEVTTYPRFERGWNALQVVMEVFVALVVFAGLLGLFGNGALSSAVAEAAGKDVTVEFERILRRTVDSELRIRFSKPLDRPRVEIRIPEAFLADMTVASTSPRATAMRMEADGITYVFDVGGSGTGEITFDLKPKGFGSVTSPFVVAGEPIVLRQFVFP